MQKTICAYCGAELKWGGFAYNQDMCWDCFKKEIRIMSERIDQYPSWLWDKRAMHKDILVRLTAIAAETYGYEW